MYNNTNNTAIIRPGSQTNPKHGIWNFIFGISTLILFFTTTVSAQQPDLQQDLSLKYLVQLPPQRSAHPPIIILLRFPVI